MPTARRRGAGYVYCRPRRAAVALVAAGGGPIAARSQVRWGESVRKGRSATSSTSREPVSSPRRRREADAVFARKTARVVLTLATGLLLPALAAAAALASHGRRERAVARARRPHGVLGRSVRPTGIATWFGPGFYGHKTACGQTLTPTVVGVANRTLPCGTLIRVTWHGHALTVPVARPRPLRARRRLGPHRRRRARARRHRNGSHPHGVVGATANTPSLGAPSPGASPPATSTAAGGTCRRLSAPSALEEALPARRADRARARGVDVEVGLGREPGRVGGVVGADRDADRDRGRPSPGSERRLQPLPQPLRAGAIGGRRHEPVAARAARASR